MKTIACLFFLGAFALSMGGASIAPMATTRAAPGAPPPESGSSAEDRRREQHAAFYVIEAILISPDMTFKMPVLASAFLDTPEWEQRLQQIINREQWAFAKVTFIHFYWKRVSKKDSEFMARMIDFARVQNKEFGLGDVDDMLEAETK